MIYNLLSRMLEQDNYGEKEEFQNKLDVFFVVERLNDMQYKELTDTLNAKQDNIVTPE